MARRLYSWRHSLHSSYVLKSNAAVRVDVTTDASPWRLTIGAKLVGSYRTFRLAEEAIPTATLRGAACRSVEVSR